jgi:hypothetical protein
MNDKLFVTLVRRQAAFAEVHNEAQVPHANRNVRQDKLTAPGARKPAKNLRARLANNKNRPSNAA